MKKLLVLLPVLILVFVCTAGFAAERLEGNGYDTPEEAVLAYLDALDRGDVAGMLSTFAIESYAEHMDSRLFTQYRRQYTPSVSVNYLPREDVYALSLAVQARYGGLAVSLLANEAYQLFEADGVLVRTAGERAEFEDRFRQSPALNPVGNVEFVRWADPVAMTRGQIAHLSGGRSLPLNAYAGAEDLTERIAEIRIGGRTAYQVMTCARYGGRWYNMEFGGRTLNLAGAKLSVAAYLWLPTEEEQAWIDESLAGEYPEESARWDAVQRSGIAGETWPLVSLDADGITLCGSADDAAADSGAGIYAEVHFFRNGGGVLTVTAGASLREKLYMDDAAGRFLFSWAPGGIEPYYTNKKGMAVPTYGVLYREDIGLPDVAEAVLDGPELTVVLEDGTRAVFRRPEAAVGSGAESVSAEPVGRLEGEGFASPEEAVMAYIEAMDRGDVRGMLSTFAFESLTERADTWARLDRTGYFSAKLIEGTDVPYINDYIRTLSAYVRYGNVASTLLGDYMKTATWTDAPLQLKEPEEVTAFLEQIRLSPLYELAGNVKFDLWLDPEILTDGMILGNSILAGDAAVYGGDDITEVAALIRAKGRYAIQTMRCIRYGDRWYNLNLLSMTAMSMVSYTGSGSLNELALILLTDDALGEIAKRVIAADPDGKTVWESIRHRDIVGERWPLALAGGCRIYGTPEDAENDPDGVWAELHWLQGGSAAIALYAGETVREKLGLSASPAWFRFSWKPDGNKPESTGAEGILCTDMYPLNSAGRDTFLTRGETVTIETSETIVTMILPDGTPAVFSRPGG